MRYRSYFDEVSLNETTFIFSKVEKVWKNLDEKKNTPSSIRAEGKMKLDIETEEDIGRNGYVSDVIFHWNLSKRLIINTSWLLKRWRKLCEV